MTVICKVTQCPYLSSRGFCRNKLLNITGNGLCGHIYDKRGQIKQNWQERIDSKFMNEDVFQEEEKK